MKDTHSKWVLQVFLALGCLGLATPSELWAQRGGSYDLSFNSVDGGGGTSMSQDGRYSVSGTVGQPDAGTLGEGQFGLQGGFWGGSGVRVAAFSLLAGVGLGLLVGRGGVRRLRAGRRTATAA